MTATVVRAGAGAPSSLGADTVTRRVTGVQTEGALAVFHYVGRTRGGPPLHVHPDQDELFWVQAGDYRFRCGDEDHRLGPGDSIFLPRGIAHSFAQLSAAGELIFLFTPAGKMDAFFTAAAEAGPPDPATAAALFAAHDMIVVGPPLPLE